MKDWSLLGKYKHQHQNITTNKSNQKTQQKNLTAKYTLPPLPTKGWSEYNELILKAEHHL